MPYKLNSCALGQYRKSVIEYIYFFKIVILLYNFVFSYNVGHQFRTCVKSRISTLEFTKHTIISYLECFTPLIP